MWDDEHDKKLKEAAENFQPEPDESAWQKMEKMLDENLPQQKDRKRILFFLPFILISAGLMVFLFFYTNRTRDSIRQDISKNAVSRVATNPAEPQTRSSFRSTTNGIPKSVVGSGATAPENRRDESSENVNSFNDRLRYHERTSDNRGAVSATGISSAQSKTSVFNELKKETGSTSTNAAVSVTLTKEDQPLRSSPAEKPQKEGDRSLPANLATDDKDTAQRSVKQRTVTENNFAGHFTVSLSTGPGVSYVGNNSGKLTMDFGIGLGYHFSKHFSVRTGAFISRKIYSATPSQYSYPGGSTYNYLQKINADCNVIDIPVNIDYNFGKKGKHAWLVSGGLSSYLMKKESYDYVYKTPAGVVYNKNQTISNQNKHFFSILNLSGGYEYLLSKRFSLAAEPFIDIPLTGIGEGKVKLNSAGVLFTLKAKPFVSKNK